VPKFWVFPLTLIAALTTVLRTTVLRAKPNVGLRPTGAVVYKSDWGKT